MDVPAQLGYTLVTGAQAQFEYFDRKSRFIATLAAVSSVQEAQELVSAQKALYHDARHWCRAWVLFSGEKQASDDGEPSHTAGLPILERLESAQLANVCCVVTRYFGGTLLGPGGLKRAYGSAAAGAIDEAHSQGLIQAMGLVREVVVLCSYADYEHIRYLALSCQALSCTQTFTDTVQLDCSFVDGTHEAFLGVLTERFAGRVSYSMGAPTLGPVPA